MANEGNLKPLNTICKEDAKKIQSKGGKARSNAIKKRKTMKEQMLTLLSLPLKDGKTKQSLEQMGIDTSQINNQMAVVASTYMQALKGNMNAVNVIREIIGERVMEVNVNQNIDDKVKELNKLLDDE